MKISIVSGTNRKGSNTLKVARIVQREYAALGVQTGLVDLCDLPLSLFTPEAYNEKPKAFEPFNNAILSANGVVVVTPEYNGSFPGVLKYFIDMLKFPESFENRPVAFIGVAAGYFGALRSVEQLQMVFSYRRGFLFNERLFIPRIHEEIQADGTFKTPLYNRLLTSQVQHFTAFCQAIQQASQPQ